MAKETPGREAFEKWTATLDRMQQGLAEALERTRVPQPEEAARENAAGRDELGRLGQRLAECAARVEEMGQDAGAAAAASAERITELQNCSAAAARARDRLAAAAEVV